MVLLCAGLLLAMPIASSAQETPFTTTPMAATGVHSVALRSDGTVWTWGDNFSGQLGNGTSGDLDYTVPVQVRNLNHVVAIARGERHVLALRDDGTVWA